MGSGTDDLWRAIAESGIALSKKPSALEAFGAEQLAGKLRAHLEEVQRIIAERCDPVCPFRADTNLLGQMAALLQERRYSDIRAMLEQWQMWIEDCSTIVREMNTAATLIAGFCEFYEKTNGFAQEGGK